MGYTLNWNQNINPVAKRLELLFANMILLSITILKLAKWTILLTLKLNGTNHVTVISFCFDEIHTC